MAKIVNSEKFFLNHMGPQPDAVIYVARPQKWDYSIGSQKDL